MRGVLVPLLVWTALLAPSRALAQAPESDPVVPDARRAVLEHVLERPEFQRTAAAVVFEEAQKRLSAWFLRIWDRFGLSRLGTERVATGLAWVLALLALAALTWWLVQSVARSGSRQRLGIRSPAGRGLSARAWARLAVEAAAAGHTREAARCAYRAAVVRLEEEGAWRQDEARTPREYLRILPAAHKRYPLAADVTTRFERAWYGAIESSDDTQALLARLEELGCHASDHAT